MTSFAEKFERALDEMRAARPGSGLRTIAMTLADDDPRRAETIRRRLQKYRPRPGGAQKRPTASTRQEIERAMGLELNALQPDGPVTSSLLEDARRCGAASIARRASSSSAQSLTEGV